MLFMLQKHCLYLSILIIMDYSLFSSWYMAFGSGVYGIWILFGYGIYLMALHHVALHCTALAYGVMSWTYGSDRTGTASFIGHNDAASYLDWYESKFICIHMHAASLIWHNVAASYLDEYEGRSLCALIYFFKWLNVGCDGGTFVNRYVMPLC